MIKLIKMPWAFWKGTNQSICALFTNCLPHANPFLRSLIHVRHFIKCFRGLTVDKDVHIYNLQYVK